MKRRWLVCDEARNALRPVLSLAPYVAVTLCCRQPDPLLNTASGDVAKGPIAVCYQARTAPFHPLRAHLLDSR